MILTTVQQQLWQDVTSIMIPVEKIANVRQEHNLAHAHLILSKMRYAMIPVLDKEDYLRGLISLPMIINALDALDTPTDDDMQHMLVKDVMKTDMPIVHKDITHEEVLHLLVDQNFLAVVDEKGVFIGMITRREVLKRVNHVLHSLHEIKIKE